LRGEIFAAAFEAARTSEPAMNASTAQLDMRTLDAFIYLTSVT
jgi:hypothetical protein